MLLCGLILLNQMKSWGPSLVPSEPELWMGEETEFLTHNLSLKNVMNGEQFLSLSLWRIGQVCLRHRSQMRAEQTANL